MSERQFDPAAEPPAPSPSGPQGADYAGRGSTWFLAGVFAVVLVFGGLWFVGVLEPALNGGGISLTEDEVPLTVDTEATTASTGEEGRSLQSDR